MLFPYAFIRCASPYGLESTNNEREDDEPNDGFNHLLAKAFTLAHFANEMLQAHGANDEKFLFALVKF